MFTNTHPSTLAEWIKLLSISTQFSFPDIREQAISELNNNYTVDPAERIILAEACHVPEWKEPAFMDLVWREEFIRYEEVVKLGPKLSHRLYVAREEDRKNAASACHRCQGSSTEETALRNDPTSSDLTIHNYPPPSHPTHQDDPSPSDPEFHDSPSSLYPILHDDPSCSTPTSFDDRPSPDPPMFITWRTPTEEEPVDEDNGTRHASRNEWHCAYSRSSWTPGWTTLGGTILT
jgi:hypothetical protein